MAVVDLYGVVWYRATLHIYVDIWIKISNDANDKIQWKTEKQKAEVYCLQIIVCLLLRVPSKDWAEEDWLRLRDQEGV